MMFYSKTLFYFLRNFHENDSVPALTDEATAPGTRPELCSQPARNKRRSGIELTADHKCLRLEWA